MATSGSNLISCGILAIVASGALFFQAIEAQVPSAEFNRLVAMDAWSEDELKQLEKGDPVVRSLPTSEKQELATIGVVKIKNLPAISMQLFRESLSQKDDKTRKVGAKFTTPASIDDLRALELDDNAVEQLRECTVGKCGLNLSAEHIARFHNEVDWNSPDAKERATNVFREILLAYVNAYSARGDAALESYDNQRDPVDLTDVHRALLANAQLITQIAPEFAAYLKQYPNGNLAGVENGLHWSVMDFGLKPSIMLSHAAAYTQTTGQSEQYFVASKQIYSSRYLDASLTFTMLLRVAGANGLETYLVFLDRSRAAALGGAIGRFARGVVERQAAERVRSYLDKTHLRILAATRPNTEATMSMRSSHPLAHRLLSVARSRVTFALLATAIAGMLLFLWRRRRLRTPLIQHHG